MKNLLTSLCLLALLCVGMLTVAVAQRPEKIAQPLTTAEGTVSKIEEPKAVENPVNFTLTIADGTTYRVSSAPAAVLKKLGLVLTENAKVSVTGRAMERTGKDGVKINVLMAHSVTLDGKTVVFIDEKNKQTWTYDDIAPATTATGTVKDLTMPEEVAPGATTGKRPQQNVTFTLHTDKDDLKFSYNARKATKLGITLKNDQAITVSYWQFNANGKPILRDITIDGKTYTL